MLLDGVRLFNADDGGNRDAVAWEVQDACQGHPERTGQYHQTKEFPYTVDCYKGTPVNVQ